MCCFGWILYLGQIIEMELIPHHVILKCEIVLLHFDQISSAKFIVSQPLLWKSFTGGLID